MRLRKRVLDSLPPPVRTGLRGARDLAQQTEARVREYLPARLGGRFRSSDVECRVLGPSDADDFAALYGISDGAVVRARLGQGLEQPRGFAMGIYVNTRLVAAGWCLEQWAHIGIGGHWMAGDFVDLSLRRRGLAQVLHAARLAEAATRGVSVVRAVVFAHNKPSQRAFQRLGWTRFRHAEWERKISDHYQRCGRTNPDFLLFERRTEAPDP